MKTLLLAVLAVPGFAAQREAPSVPKLPSALPAVAEAAAVQGAGKDAAGPTTADVSAAAQLQGVTSQDSAAKGSTSIEARQAQSFDGANIIAPGSIEAVKQDWPAALDHMGVARNGKELSRRLSELQSHRGVPRSERTGWFTWETRVDRLSPAVLSELPALARAVEHIKRRPGTMGEHLALNDLLYSLGVLVQRAGSVEALAADLRWLYGTFGMPQ